MEASDAPVLLIDLDGTLVDSAPDIAEAVNLLLAELGAEPLRLAEVAAKVGDGAARLVERALSARRLSLDLEEATARFLSLYLPRLVEQTRPYPGVPETLAALGAEGWKLAVCTNKPLDSTHRILEALELDRFFAAVSGADSFPVKKPHPDHLRLTLAALGGRPQTVIMVGDGRNDLLAAASAGMQAIWAAYGYGGEAAAALPHAARIEAFAELPGILARLCPQAFRAEGASPKLT